MDTVPLLCELMPEHLIPVPLMDHGPIDMLVASAFANDTVADVRDWFPNGRRRGS